MKVHDVYFLALAVMMTAMVGGSLTGLLAVRADGQWPAIYSVLVRATVRFAILAFFAGLGVVGVSIFQWLER
jgi:hypothetical protein